MRIEDKDLESYWKQMKKRNYGVNTNSKMRI